MTSLPEDLEKDFTLKDVADALGMSERWVRYQIKDGAEHQRYGHKIRFTAEQVEKLRASFATSQPQQSMTTGRGKS